MLAPKLDAFRAFYDNFAKMLESQRIYWEMLDLISIESSSFVG